MRGTLIIIGLVLVVRQLDPGVELRVDEERLRGHAPGRREEALRSLAAPVTGLRGP